MKKFLKSDWFKCTAVLLSLLIILGGTLAILNDLLFVSPEDRTRRAISKFYETNPQYTIILDYDENGVEEKNDFGYIQKIYEVGQDLLFKSTGINGYKGGTITLWLKVIKNAENGHYQIEQIVLDSYEKQTLMSKFTQSYFNNEFLIDVTEAYATGDYIFSNKSDSTGKKNPMSGATYSANAACNAVNCVITYLGGIAQ